MIDAAIIAKECDGAVLVIESGKTKYRLVQEVKAKIENSGCPVLGAVLSKVEVAKADIMAKSMGNITVIMNRRGARGCVQSHSLFLKKMIDKPVFL